MAPDPGADITGGAVTCDPTTTLPVGIGAEIGAGGKPGARPEPETDPGGCEELMGRERSLGEAS